VTEAPGLRLAWALPPDERAADPLCAELAWAETIVRVEVDSESLLQHIRQEIRSFPAEFLLFFPIATALTLDDGEDKAREVRLAIEGAEHILHDGDTVSRWRIAAREVRITKPEPSRTPRTSTRASPCPSPGPCRSKGVVKRQAASGPFSPRTRRPTCRAS
jgi:hypothetical protein